jgi:uncharacterized protein (DUF4415 family)
MKSKNSSPISEPRLRVGLQDATREDFAQAVREQLGQERVSMMVDADVLAYFKAKAGGQGYQQLMNRTLRDAMTGDQLESTIRRVIREELMIERASEDG